MKILLREFGEKEYEWKDAEFVDGMFRVEGRYIHQTNIVSISDDNRGNFVKCSKCGEIFTKDSPEIEAHKMRYKDINNCFKCRYLSKACQRTIGTTYERMPDGRYKLITESAATLNCDLNRWNYFDDCSIESEGVRNRCYLKKCESAEFVGIEDIFTKHPGIFDDIITADKIIAAGYKDTKRYDDRVMYRIKGRNEIWAIVNGLGIVDHFSVSYHNYRWQLVYSKKLDKLYLSGSTEYAEWNQYEVNDTTKQYIKNKISELYN